MSAAMVSRGPRRALPPGWRFIKMSEQVLPLPSQPAVHFSHPGSPEMQPSPSLRLPRSCLQAFPASTLQARGEDGAGGRPCHLECRQPAVMSPAMAVQRSQLPAARFIRRLEIRHPLEIRAETSRANLGLPNQEKERREDCFQRVLSWEESGHDFRENRQPGLSHLSGSGLR